MFFGATVFLKSFEWDSDEQFAHLVVEALTKIWKRIIRIIQPKSKQVSFSIMKWW